MADGTGGKAPPGQDGRGEPAPGAHAQSSTTATLQSMAADWITIWQSELAAMATDREMQDGWVRLVSLWAQTAERATHLLAGAAYNAEAGRAGPAPPQRPASPVAAPDARDATLQRLADRIEALERRLDSVDPGHRGPGG